MSHTRAGLLFTLAEPVERVGLLAGAESWRRPLEEAGVEVLDGFCEQLVVAPASHTAEVASSPAHSAILFGASPGRELARAGFTVKRFLPVPSLAEPSVLIPLDQPGAARYALSNLSVPSGTLKRLRNVLAGIAISGRVPLPGAVTVAMRDPGLPFPIQTGQELGLPARLDWVLALGRATERSAYFIFEPRDSRPSWVLKFSPDHRSPKPFIEDKHGHDLLDEVGGTTSEHSPALVGISTAGPRPLTVESAALGVPLVYWLRSSGARAEKRKVTEAVAHWLIQVASETALPGAIDSVFDDLPIDENLLAEVGADVDALRSSLQGLPAVFEHRDIDPTHILIDGQDFTVIDWEAARRHGLPLGDLSFLLSQALPILDGELDDKSYGRRLAFARLFRGESPSAPLLFNLLAEACDTLAIPREHAGALLSLNWLRLSRGPRQHLAEVWFADDALGPDWPAWQRTV